MIFKDLLRPDNIGKRPMLPTSRCYRQGVSLYHDHGVGFKLSADGSIDVRMLQ